jgi:hypothetical protein
VGGGGHRPALGIFAVLSASLVAHVRASRFLLPLNSSLD